MEIQNLKASTLYPLTAVSIMLNWYHIKYQTLRSWIGTNTDDSFKLFVIYAEYSKQQKNIYKVLECLKPTPGH